MPTPDNIITAQTALNRVELSLHALRATTTDPATLNQAVNDLAVARNALA